MTPKLKRGIYATWYGNAAFVSGPSAKTAYDMDSAERIPLSELDPDTHKPMRDRYVDTSR